MYINSKWEMSSSLVISMVSLGAESSLYVSKEPVRSKVTVSDEDIIRAAEAPLRPLLLRAAAVATGTEHRKK